MGLLMSNIGPLITCGCGMLKGFGSLSPTECNGVIPSLSPTLQSALVQGSGFRVQGAGCRVQGAGFRVQGSGCRVQGSGVMPSLSPALQSALLDCFGFWVLGFGV